MAKETIGTEITKKAFEYIDAVASNLGVATEYVFTILVRQQFAEGIAWLVISIITVVLGGFLLKWFFRGTNEKLKGIREKQANRWYETSDGEDIFLGLRWVVFVAYSIFVIVVLSTLPNTITQIINPEYHAIKEILDALTGGKSE